LGTGHKWPGFVQPRRPVRPVRPPGERTGRSSYFGRVQRPAIFAKVLFKQTVNDGSFGGKIFVLIADDIEHPRSVFPADGFAEHNEPVQITLARRGRSQAFETDAPRFRVWARNGSNL